MIGAPTLVAWRARAAGLGSAIVIAAVAVVTARAVAAPISPVLIAMLLGLAATNLRASAARSARLAPGAGYAAQRVLRVGIVLLGAQLSVADVVDVGAGALVLVVVCMATALAVVAALGELMGIDRRTSVLIGVGTAVCGNTAIMATAPVLNADSRRVSYAVGTITLLGTLGLLLLPIAGRLLDLGDATFGLWAGLAINDTSQVVAAGTAYSDEARDVATVVKLLRNAMMAPVLAMVALAVARRDAARSPDGGRVAAGVRKAVPAFVVAFMVAVLARTVGLVPDVVAEAAGPVASIMIVVAIAGVGLTTRLGQIRTVGARPFVVGAMAAATLVGLAYLLATLTSGAR
jgi:uncharacterized integral membrane protein (TIGR00698 family)